MSSMTLPPPVQLSTAPLPELKLSALTRSKHGSYALSPDGRLFYRGDDEMFAWPGEPEVWTRVFIASSTDLIKSPCPGGCGGLVSHLPTVEPEPCDRGRSACTERVQEAQRAQKVRV